MTVFLIRRLMQSSVVIFMMAVLVFVGVYAIGNPVEVYISPDMTPETIAATMHKLGLDRPLYEQFFIFLWNALHGDLGQSFVYDMPALDLILGRMPATLELAFTSMVIALAVGIPLGMVAGYYHDGVPSKLIMAGSILGFSVPTFWIGLMLILIFSIKLGWLPSGGRGEPFTLEGLSHLVMPATNLALFKLALVVRLTRAGMRETMPLDFVKFARAKGLSMRRVIFVHVFKNILIPLVTVLGMELGSVIAFAVVTEQVFAWPGMGKLLIDSIIGLDRPVIVAYLMITVFLFIVINLVVDILYSLLDPRIRLSEAPA